MQKVLNQATSLHDYLLTAFGRTTDRKNGLHDRLLLAFHGSNDHTHFNDGEEEDSPDMEFRGAVGFVANKLYAVMTLFNRREDRRYAEWEKEDDERHRRVAAVLEDAPLIVPEPIVE